MLLLPAPLLARGGRWLRTDNLRRSCVRVVHVVTAFAVGHSITLALAAVGYLSAPTQLVESLIALSILVLSRTRLYPAVRIALAGLGIVAAAAWLAERKTLIASNPLDDVSEALVAHPFVVAAALACVAVAGWAVPGSRTPSISAI